MPFKWAEDKKKYHKIYHRKWYIRNSREVKKKQKERRREIREWFFSYKKTLKCQLCPENHPGCLDFHHKNRSDKGACVVDMVTGGRCIAAIKAEMEKCMILCSNCHRKLHFDSRGKQDSHVDLMAQAADL
jgi:5-methylcytosine-specific restriction endonuclease McrA